MRLKITLGEEKEYKMPWSYNYFLASSIYFLLSKYSKRFSQTVHSYGWRYKNKNLKLFSFSPLFPKKIFFEKEYIIMIGPFVFIISSPDSVFIEILENVIKKEKFLRILNYFLPVLKTNIYEIEKLSNTFRVRTLSPLVVSEIRNEEGKKVTSYLSPDSENFYKKLKNIIKEKFECFTGEVLLSKDLEIFCESYKSKLCRIKNINIKGYMADLYLKGDVQVLRFVLESGIGEKTSMGFGMVEKCN
ncbi:MAG: CRISPR-associated endoribonuclease Cas6 [Candidatus Hydrothermales bacterium]